MRNCAAWFVVVASLGLAFPAVGREPLPAVGTIEVAFTPWDDAEGAIIRVLSDAHQAIYVQAYLLTSRQLAQALIAARKRGVTVEILADREMQVKGENSQIPQLSAAGIPVWLEGRYVAAHNKVLLIDPHEANSVVITGSYNFTYSAQARNAENLLILRSNPSLARAYLDNWQRHRSEALPYLPGSPE